VGLRPLLDDLPDGYEVVEGERGVLAVERAFRAVLLEHGFGPDGAGRAVASDLAGRVALGEIRAPDGRLVVRHYHHGGLLRWVNSERFGEPARPFDELRLSARVAARGLPTPRVIAAWARRAPLFGWRLALVTERIEGASDSSHVLERLRVGELGAAVGAHVFATVGAFVGRLHREGLAHTDLTPRNLLVEDEILEGREGRVWALDLDRCRLDATLSDDERHAGLRRLLRYVVRRDPERAPVLSRARCARFLRAYVAALHGASEADPQSRGEWRSEWRALARHGSASRVHRIGWALEELFGGGPETRDGRG